MAVTNRLIAAAAGVPVTTAILIARAAARMIAVKIVSLKERGSSSDDSDIDSQGSSEDDS